MKFDHEAVKAANRERNAEIMEAYYTDVSEDATKGMAAALHVVADQMRERGAALVEAKKKGAIGTNKTLVLAATELSTVADSLLTDGVGEELNRAAAQIAGVAVSLDNDRSFVFNDEGMPVFGHSACGSTSDGVPEVECNRMAGHAGEHIYRDGHGVIAWGGPTPTINRKCGATPQYEPFIDDTCGLPEGHAGNHEGDRSRWPRTEADEVGELGMYAVGEIEAPGRAHDDEEGVPPGAYAEAAGGEIIYMNSGSALPPPPDGTPTFNLGPLEITAPDVVVPQPFVLDEATAQPRRAHRSVSQIEAYTNECGMKYRLTYRDAIEGTEVPCWWNVGGNAFHRCAEKIAQRWPSLATWEADEVRDLFAQDLTGLWRKEFADEIAKVQLENPAHPKSTWRAAAKGAENQAWWNDHGPEMISTYYAWHCSRLRDGWVVSGCEIEFHHAVGGVEVLGYIDRVDVRGDEFEIVDYKAGGTKPGDSFQLGMYADFWASLQAAPAKISAGYYYARKGEFVPTDRPVREKHPREEIVYRTVSMDTAERAGIYLANTSRPFGGCGSCSMKRHCPVGALR